MSLSTMEVAEQILKMHEGVCRSLSGASGLATPRHHQYDINSPSWCQFPSLYLVVVPGTILNRPFYSV